MILSAGGSKYFDQVTRAFRAAGLGRPVEVVLRSGCYFSHDSKVYSEAFARLAERMPEVRAAGRGAPAGARALGGRAVDPRAGLAVATLGKRDVSHDLGLPLARQWYRPGLHARPQDLGQGSGGHRPLRPACLPALPADSPLQVGDLVSFGISHPCTTFDKWRLLYVVDDDYTVTEAIRTFF